MMADVATPARALHKLGHVIHCHPSVAECDEVWLDTDIGDYDGLCVGSGPDALMDAAQSLAAALVVVLALVRAKADGV